ncbi:serine hydrolase [Synechococcus sp. CC9311]|uniref:serine hydrolase n=1 Tax=Synechococcus sp. (strain CC9311) TaxID=64471 RepID=UPI0000DDAA6A|nr:serine hydrolase [Synechococcus sp. CC9311]ABI45463.1 beta-lactamase, putative [Synechococcus sp. CC9311]
MIHSALDLNNIFLKINQKAKDGIKKATTISAIAATGMVLTTALPSSASEWTARHGLSSSSYQQTFNNYTKKGYCLKSISGYQQAGKANYAAIWSKNECKPFIARHGLSPQKYQAAFNAFNKKGYRLTYINGYEIGGKPFYAAIWEKTSGPAYEARHGLTEKQYQSQVTSMSGKGYGIKHVSAFSLKGSPRFAVIFEKNMPTWKARHGLTHSQYQKEFNKSAKEGYRLKVVTGYRKGNSDRYAAVWTKEGGQYYQARHSIPTKNYQHIFDNYRYQSYEPKYIEAFNSASGVKFNGVWENKKFASKSLRSIERKVGQYMRDNNIKGLSIAISKNNKLVYARGFGKADITKGIAVGPKHRFRIASVSKLVTQAAIKKLLKETSLNSNSKVFGKNSILGDDYPTPSTNPNIDKITIQHLLNHHAGLTNINKNGDKKDPMFSYSGSTFTGLINWTLSNYPLASNPGQKKQYSNFGYSLLGRVIEKATNADYDSYVKNKILNPAGAKGMVIGRDKKNQQLRNEATYYGGGAYSSVKPQRFDSHGGWIATPIDLLRFMRHNNDHGSSHYGLMDGTAAVYKKNYNSNFGYAAATNSRKDPAVLNSLMQDIVNSTSSWPSVNMF